jgi:hypothetical protein
MKKTAVLTCILCVAMLFVACKKNFEAELVILCEFEPVSVQQKAVLIASDLQGQILGTFDLPTGAADFSGTVKTGDKDFPEEFNLHLVYSEAASNHHRIFSQIRVRSGVQVFLGARQESEDFGFENSFIKPYKIAGIQSIDMEAVFIPGLAISSAFDPVSQSIHGTLRSIPNRSALFQLKANGTQELKSLFVLADELTGNDTLLLQWADFSSATTPRSVTMANGDSPTSIHVTATNANYQHYLHLGNTATLDQAGQFNLPEGMPAELNHFVIRAQTDGSYAEKVFQPGEALQFPAPGMEITSAVVNGNRLEISTGGDVDVVMAVGVQYPPNAQQNGMCTWLISGRPADMSSLVIPPIATWLPTWVNFETLLTEGEAKAARYDTYNFDQIQAGLPGSADEIFSSARSGYVEVWRTFQ